MDLQLGDIVCYDTHAYFENLTDIIISGDPQLLSPLMIVIEKLYCKEDKTIDKVIAPKIVKEYKCIWYSNKNFQFEEAWFLPFLLKRIKNNENFELINTSIGNQVVLKSHEYELNKIKSTVSYDEMEKGILNKKINSNSLLTFLSPVMNIIQIKKNDKELKNENLEVCKNVIKCKWYNAKSDKFSEYFLPQAAIKPLKFVNLDLLNEISSIINAGKFLKIKTKEIKTIVKPNTIIYKSGTYMLKGFDYLENSITDIEINGLLKFDVLKKPFTKKAPVFDFSKNVKPMVTIEKIINSAYKKRAYLRIEYKNRSEKFTIRTLKKYKIEQTIEDRKKILYLTGYCLNKEETRSFKLERIQQIQVLDINFKT